MKRARVALTHLTLSLLTLGAMAASIDTPLDAAPMPHIFMFVVLLNMALAVVAAVVGTD